MVSESTAQRDRMRRLGLRLALALGSLVVGLVLTEVGFRLARGAPWYERLVDEQAEHASWMCQVGRIMVPLRESLRATPKQADEYRILFLGDSFTFGTGVDDVSKTFVQLVRQRLNATQPLSTPRRYQVFNGGIPASLVDKWVALFGEANRLFQPDLVVAVFFLRDGVRGVTSQQQILKIREEMARLVDESWLFHYSYIYRFFRENREQKRLADEYLNRIREGYFGDAEQTNEWKRAQDGLLQIRHGAQKRGIPFAVVVFPVLIELDDDYPLKNVCDLVESFCRDHEIPVLSLLPTFMGHRASALWVSPIDQHPNETGHALAAEAIYGFLSQLMRSPRMQTVPPGSGVTAP